MLYETNKQTNEQKNPKTAVFLRSFMALGIHFPMFPSEPHWRHEHHPSKNMMMFPQKKEIPNELMG